ncbi:MAG: YbaK/EbsC family protein, partial [Xanthomonadales bacterium]|nr:YbaK/EbsC family protein [Xanthomonadales bacterium]
MTVAKTVDQYLQSRDIVPEVVRHDFSGCASESAEAAHISGHRVAKGIVLKSEDRMVLVVAPASHHVALSKVREALDADLTFASEAELAPLFPDCETGA